MNIVQGLTFEQKPLKQTGGFISFSSALVHHEVIQQRGCWKRPFLREAPKPVKNLPTSSYSSYKNRVISKGLVTQLPPPKKRLVGTELLNIPRLRGFF